MNYFITNYARIIFASLAAIPIGVEYGPGIGWSLFFGLLALAFGRS